MDTTVIDAILDVDPALTRPDDVLTGELVPVPAPEVIDVPATEDGRLDDDFQFTRQAMRDIITKGRQATDSAIMLAQAGDEPRPYEVVGTLISSLVSANKELMRLHHTRRVVIEPTSSASPLLPTGTGGAVNIDKAVFVGRASDLLREIRQLAKSTGEDANG